MSWNPFERPKAVKKEPDNVVELPVKNETEDKPILVQDPRTGQVIGRASSEAEAKAMTANHIEASREAA